LIPPSPAADDEKNSKPSNNQGAIDAVAGPALSGEIQCFVGPAGTVVGLRYGSAQVNWERMVFEFCGFFCF